MLRCGPRRVNTVAFPSWKQRPQWNGSRRCTFRASRSISMFDVVTHSRKGTIIPQSTNCLLLRGRVEQQRRRNMATFTSVYDRGSTDWRSWLTPAEYENPWDSSSSNSRRFSGPLLMRTVDCATKHVIAQLQTFHHFEQHVTTELCNAMLRNLLDLLPPPSTSNSSPHHHAQRPVSPMHATNTVLIAERARAILENMQLLETVMNPSLVSSSSLRVPRALPKPNRETFNTVLLVYARTLAPDRTMADEAAALVRYMQHCYQTRHALELKPVNFHVNCVLLAWMHSGDADKAKLAWQWLLEHASASRYEAASLVDASSYIHVLRICAYGRASTTTANGNVGATVAIQLWQAMFEQDEHHRHSKHGSHYHRLPVHVPENLPSHFYSHFLQAIRPLPVRSAQRHTYYAACFQRACTMGKVNLYVLQDFFVHVKHPAVFEHFFGPYRNQIHGQSADQAAQHLMQLIPAEWTVHAD
jgi:hypothetical protein